MSTEASTSNCTFFWNWMFTRCGCAPSFGTGCSPDAATHYPTSGGARAQAPPAHRSQRQPVEEVCGGGVV